MKKKKNLLSLSFTPLSQPQQQQHKTKLLTHRVQDRKLERSARRRVHRGDRRLGAAQLPAKGQRELEQLAAPLLRRPEGRGVVELAAHVEREGLARGRVEGERVHLHEREVEVLEDRDAARDERGHRRPRVGRQTRQQRGQGIRARAGPWRGVRRRGEMHCLDLVPVLLDLHPSGVGKGQVDARTDRLDRQIKLCVVRDKGLDDKGRQRARDVVHGELAAHALADKGLGGLDVEVEADEVFFFFFGKRLFRRVFFFLIFVYEARESCSFFFRALSLSFLSFSSTPQIIFSPFFPRFPKSMSGFTTSFVLDSQGLSWRSWTQSVSALTCDEKSFFLFGRGRGRESERAREVSKRRWRKIDAALFCLFLFFLLFVP